MSEPVDEPVLPRRGDDDRDRGWGEPVEDARDGLSAREREILQDKPPHW